MKSFRSYLENVKAVGINADLHLRAIQDEVKQYSPKIITSLSILADHLIDLGLDRISDFVRQTANGMNEVENNFTKRGVLSVWSLGSLGKILYASTESYGREIVDSRIRNIIVTAVFGMIKHFLLKSGEMLLTKVKDPQYRDILAAAVKSPLSNVANSVLIYTNMRSRIYEEDEKIVNLLVDYSFSLEKYQDWIKQYGHYIVH